VHCTKISAEFELGGYSPGCAPPKCGVVPSSNSGTETKTKTEIRGSCFRTEDLDRLSRYMMMFYAEQPVDWLMVSFRQSMGQRKPLLRKPTLFQHFGVTSSFDTSRLNNLKDRFHIAWIEPSYLLSTDLCFNTKFFFLFFALKSPSSLNGTQRKLVTRSEVTAVWKRMSKIWHVPSPYQYQQLY